MLCAVSLPTLSLCQHVFSLRPHVQVYATKESTAGFTMGSSVRTLWGGYVMHCASVKSKAWSMQLCKSGMWGF